MPRADVSIGNIYYEVEGEPSDPPLLLIAGQGAQLISWPCELRNRLLDSGFRLILFDNRDCGLSSAVEGAYDISDMADDVAELLDVLHIDAAHIVGQSMGGMIAQELTVRHPHRVLSLCSIYSAPGAAFVTSDPEIWTVREKEPALDRDGAIRQYIENERISGLEEYSEEWILEYATTVVDRAYRPDGAARQLAAVRRQRDRTRALTDVNVPTVVLHGLDDVLVHHSGGLATAAAIDGAELHLYAAMGHQLLPSLFEDYTRAITRNCLRSAQFVTRFNEAQTDQGARK
jgi:pimeloyl-ACP methyl ester carboxylesterase